MGAPGLAKMIDLEIEPGLGAVLVDKIQIQQVVLNLLRNAIDAVRGAPVRKVRVSAVARDGDTAQITVSDTGRGLSSEEQVHLFDTFFSTKANGLGIGLPIYRTIVEVHGGRKIGRASCRERVSQYVQISDVDDSLKQNNNNTK